MQSFITQRVKCDVCLLYFVDNDRDCKEEQEMFPNTKLIFVLH